MIRLGVVTDVHFGPEAYHGGLLRKMTAQGPPLLKAFAKRMREHSRPDLLVSLGDAIEDEDHDRDLARLRGYGDVLAGAGIERVMVPGNHDVIHVSEAELAEAWGLPPRPHLYHSFDRGGVHFVVLHTRETKDVAIHVEDEQLRWLEADLAAADTPTVVLMHHSAADQDVARNHWFVGKPELCLVAERRRLRSILEASGRVRLVLNGHLHWNHLMVHGGIPYVTLQSMIENVEDDAPGRAAGAFAEVTVDAHTVAIDVHGAEPCRYQFAHA